MKCLILIGLVNEVEVKTVIRVTKKKVQQD